MNWKKSEMTAAYELFKENGYCNYIAVGLAKAGIKTVDEAEEYLNGDELYSPKLIKGISMVSDIIWSHIYSKSRICIFGDYDADGITASAIMFLALKKLGANVVVRLPDRIEEGYGISKKAIDEQLEQDTKLFITVDNGIRAIEETAYIKEQGCSIVILDHHEPGDNIPKADALIDLHIPGETYPFVELTGSGLAWKVAHYMLEQMGEHDYAMSLVDLAAIGTVGDVAPLHGENRVIVKRAIKRMRDPLYDRPGISMVMNDMSCVTAEDIAFRLAPCLNAPGRLTSKGAELPLILLLEPDPKIASRLAEEVIRSNEYRKRLQAECYKGIREAAKAQMEMGDKVLVLCSDEAPSGIVGLLAGNLKEDFNRPVIVFAYKADSNGEVNLTGSARSIEGFHMLNGIEACSQHLVRFGGHRMAAGLTLLPEKLEAFRKAINEYAEYLTDEDLDPCSSYDIEIMQEDLNDELYSDMVALEPYGAEAPRPILKLSVKLEGEDTHRFMGAEGQHLKLLCGDLSLVGFNLAEKYIEMCLPDELIIYGTLGLNNYRGKNYKQLSMLDFTQCSKT